MKQKVILAFLSVVVVAVVGIGVSTISQFLSARTVYPVQNEHLSGKVIEVNMGGSYTYTYAGQVFAEPNKEVEFLITGTNQDNPRIHMNCDGGSTTNANGTVNANCSIDVSGNLSVNRIEVEQVGTGAIVAAGTFRPPFKINGEHIKGVITTSEIYIDIVRYTFEGDLTGPANENFTIWVQDKAKDPVFISAACNDFNFGSEGKVHTTCTFIQRSGMEPGYLHLKLTNFGDSSYFSTEVESIQFE